MVVMAIATELLIGHLVVVGVRLRLVQHLQHLRHKAAVMGVTVLHLQSQTQP